MVCMLPMYLMSLNRHRTPTKASDEATTVALVLNTGNALQSDPEFVSGIYVQYQSGVS